MIEQAYAATPATRKRSLGTRDTVQDCYGEGRTFSGWLLTLTVPEEDEQVSNDGEPQPHPP
jgi:hypothetical protein